MLFREVWASLFFLLGDRKKKAAESGLLNCVIKETALFVYNSQKKYEKPLAKIALCFYNKNRYYELVLKSG